MLILSFGGDYLPSKATYGAICSYEKAAFKRSNFNDLRKKAQNEENSVKLTVKVRGVLGTRK